MSNNELNATLYEIFKRLPSWKFIPLAYQIASRFGTQGSPPKSKNKRTPSQGGCVTFETALNQLILRIGVQHPYHTLLHILALSNADRVDSR